jgi:prepilin-type N-terminal cleavage/methylation domain-containing protein
MQPRAGGHYHGMNPATKPHARPGGFTLVELLVVIGLIVVLIAMIVGGVRHTRSLALRQETQVELKLCEDMLAEYKAVNGFKTILGTTDHVDMNLPIRLPSQWITGQFNSPLFVYPKNNGSTEVTAQVFNPVSTLTFVNFKGSQFEGGGPAESGNLSDTTDPNNPRWVSDVVRWTQGVMFILLKDPKNRALVSNLPPTRLLENMPAPLNNVHLDVVGKPQPPYTIDAALPLDGWRNPIIFVPPGGMHVWMDPTGPNTFESRGEYVVRTSGVYKVGSLPPVGRNDRPFFASAGQDAIFTSFNKGGDYAADNIYSFQMR